MQSASRPRTWLKKVAWSVAGAVVLLLVATNHHRMSNLLAAPEAPASAEPPPKQQVGLAALEERLGRQTPVGRNIIIGHVEGGAANAYLPEAGQERFGGVRFVARSGRSATSPHAHATAKILYGPSGMAPGVRTVHCFSSANWLTDGFLKIGTDEPPQPDQCRLFNHSWIAGHDPGAAAMILRRVDYAIDQNSTLMVVGVDNGRQAGVPMLLASAYNVIAVGRADGRSSGGYTLTDGPGRCKPDVVAPAPGTKTSFATPMVTGIVARLMEVADGMPAESGATRPEVIKAVLMAGAEKPAEWRRREGKPLDEFFGAGVVRVDRSYDILTAGPVAAGPTFLSQGWAYAEVSSRESARWYLELSEPTAEASIMLVWHRHIDGRLLSDTRTRKTIWIDTPSLADLDMQLLDATGKPVAEAATRGDNVEHIHLKNLPAGRYELEVTRADRADGNWRFALAWRMTR